MPEEGRLGTPLSSLEYYVGKIEMLLGLVFLELAAFLLRLHARGRGASRDWDMVFRLMTVMMAGVVGMLLSERPKKVPHRILSLESRVYY